MDKLDQQHQEQTEQQRTSEILNALLDRLDGIEKNQREVVKATNEATQNVSRVWVEMEQMQRLMQQQKPSAVSASGSHEKTLTTLANTQKEILDLLGHSKSMKLPDGSSVSAADLSAHMMMQKVSARIRVLETTEASLADEVHRMRAVNIDHEKLATYLVPRLGKQIAAYERAVQGAFEQASAPMLEELEKGRAALNDAGAKVSNQVRRAGEHVEKLGGVVTWRTVGQIAAALLPLALAVIIVFGTAQTLWAAFGLHPILQTMWAWFLSAPEWYWKLAIASAAFAILGAFGWLTWWLGKKLYHWYKGW